MNEYAREPISNLFVFFPYCWWPPRLPAFLPMLLFLATTTAGDETLLPFLKEALRLRLRLLLLLLPQLLFFLLRSTNSIKSSSFSGFMFFRVTKKSVVFAKRVFAVSCLTLCWFQCHWREKFEDVIEDRDLYLEVIYVVFPHSHLRSKIKQPNTHYVKLLSVQTALN